MSTRVRADIPHDITLPAYAVELIGRLFGAHSRIIVDGELGGGFSGSRVLRVVPVALDGTPELPAVVKLGPADDIIREAAAYRNHIRGRLSGAVEVWGDAVVTADGTAAALRYALVGGGLFQIVSLADFCLGASLDDLVQAIEERLFVQLGAVWRYAKPLADVALVAAGYDRLLPPNLIVAPERALAARPARRPSSVHYIRADEPVTFQPSLIDLGASVAIVGFETVDIDSSAQEVTLDVPDRASVTSDVPTVARFRVRLQPVDELAAWRRDGGATGTIGGVVTATRRSQLRAALASVLGDTVDLDAAQLPLPHMPAVIVPNPLHDLADGLARRRTMRFGITHGDLNLDNVLVDPGARTVRMIDFADSGEGHVLHDLLRLETGVLTRLVPAALSDAGLPMSAVHDVLDQLHARPGVPLSSALIRYQLVLALIRRAAVQLLGVPGDWREYYDGLTAYLLGSIKFRNLGAPAKSAAFWAAATAQRLSALGAVVDDNHLADAVATLLMRQPAGPTVPNNLPTALTTFVGRAVEIGVVRELLSSHRLITLAGLGGTGKTRLALEVAALSANRFSDGAWFVDLASVTDPDAVAQATAGVFGLREETGRSGEALLLDHLRPRNVVLVLDNCEHVVTAAAKLIGEVLREAPLVHVVATSREVMGVQGEAVYLVPPLPVPPAIGRENAWSESALDDLARSDAVHLFVERAKVAQPAFSLSAANASAVAQIVRRLDGIPLAIEMAAARARVIPAEDICRRLDDRFELLKSMSPAVPQRQRTLRAVLDWSHDLLSDTEKLFFRRLAVFRGGWSLTAAEMVCAGEPVKGSAVLDLTALLVDKSIVIADTVRGAARFQMLETVRQYASAKLTADLDQAVTHRRHADYYASLAQQAAEGLDGSEQGVWLEHVDADFDNVRAALSWLTEHVDGPQTRRLAAALGSYWLIRGHLVEGRRWAERALALPDDGTDPDLRAEAANLAGGLAFEIGDFGAARTHYREVITLADARADRHAMATARRNLGKTLDELGDYDTAEQLQRESLGLMRELGDRWGEAAALNNLGLVALHRGASPTAYEHLRSSLDIFRSLAVPWAIGVSLTNVAVAAIDVGDHRLAGPYLEEALGITRSLGDRPGMAYSLTRLAEFAHRFGQADDATRWLAQAREILREVEDASMTLEWLEVSSEVVAAGGDTVRAVVVQAAADGLRQAIGKPVYPRDRDRDRDRVAGLRRTLGDLPFDAAWATGQAMHWRTALDFVDLGS